MIRSALIAFAIALSVSGCATAPTGNVDFDATQDFSAYQSFSWHSANPMRVGKTTSQPKSSLQPRIMAAIRSNLESGGYRYLADASAADFVISFVVGSREIEAPDAQASTTCSQGAIIGWVTAFCGGQDESAYSQGALAIDIFDASERRQVWHGVAARRIYVEDGEVTSEVIDSVVADILGEYPPK